MTSTPGTLNSNSGAKTVKSRTSPRSKESKVANGNGVNKWVVGISIGLVGAAVSAGVWLGARDPSRIEKKIDAHMSLPEHTGSERNRARVIERVGILETRDRARSQEVELLRSEISDLRQELRERDRHILEELRLIRQRR